MISEELLALADELESCGPDCDECPAFEQAECRGYCECTENVSKYCARRIREAVERDGESATTVSAYDLLPDDERKAITWIREHGGLDAVEKRLIPEGMEWPRYTDGSAVEIGDEVVGPDYGERIHVDAVKFHAKGFTFYDKNGFDKWYEDDDRFERSEPKALDAGGVEIRVGDTVWDVESGIEYEVVGIHTDEDTPVRVMRTDGSHLAKAAKPSTLTHRAPVLAADGEPLEVGQTVWRDDGEMLEVLYLRPDGLVDCCGEIERPERLTHDRPVLDADGVEIRVGDTVWEVRSHRRREIVGTHYRDYKTGEPLILCDGDDEIPIPATFVTHTKPEPPDTWERLEHDAEKTVCEYFGANYDCANCPLEPDRCDEEAKKDIIRRAKKLAERGA